MHSSSINVFPVLHIFYGLYLFYPLTLDKEIDCVSFVVATSDCRCFLIATAKVLHLTCDVNSLEEKSCKNMLIKCSFYVKAS